MSNMKEKTMKKKLMALYEKTLNNCKFYESAGESKHLHNEIGCLRGIAYCLEAVGVDPFTLPELFHFIGIQNEF